MSNTLKKTIRKLHLWLGLASGVVVFIVSLTGAIYVFQEEINLALQAGVFKNVEEEEENTPRLSPLEIEEIAKSDYQDTIIYMNATVFPGSTRANVVWVRNKQRKYTGIVQSPYSGETIHQFQYGVTFWAVILSMHTSLLIPEVGDDIVAISTIIFVIMLISGIYLWFPKNKKGYKQRFKVKWGASPKRLNYDLHNILGFYISIAALIIAITGLVMTYNWMKEAVYSVASGGAEVPQREEIKADYLIKDSKASQLNATFQNIFLEYGDNVKQYFIEYPVDSTGVYHLTVNTNDGFWVNKSDEYFINPADGRILNKNLYKNKNNGEKTLDANLNIHTGSVLGIAGKIIAFLASLIAASLPITGFYIWRGRKKRKKARQ